MMLFSGCNMYIHMNTLPLPPPSQHTHSDVCVHAQNVCLKGFLCNQSLPHTSSPRSEGCLASVFFGKDVIKTQDSVDGLPARSTDMMA